MRFIFTTIILITLFFTSCEETDTFGDEQYGQLKGIIYDASTETPMHGVTLTTNPASTALVSNDEGVFHFNKVKSGDLAISIKKKDYQTQTVNVNVEHDEETFVTIYMTKDEATNSNVTINEPVPGNGATDQKISITFKWKVEKSGKDVPLTYSVFYYESGSTVRKVVGENLNQLQAYIDGLKYETTYYWYVVAKSDGEAVANSPTWSFKTDQEKDL